MLFDTFNTPFYQVGNFLGTMPSAHECAAISLPRYSLLNEMRMRIEDHDVIQCKWKQLIINPTAILNIYLETLANMAAEHYDFWDLVNLTYQ